MLQYFLPLPAPSPHNPGPRSTPDIFTLTHWHIRAQLVGVQDEVLHYFLPLYASQRRAEVDLYCIDYEDARCGAVAILVHRTCTSACARLKRPDPDPTPTPYTPRPQPPRHTYPDCGPWPACHSPGPQPPGTLPFPVPPPPLPSLHTRRFVDDADPDTRKLATLEVGVFVIIR